MIELINLVTVEDIWGYVEKNSVEKMIYIATKSQCEVHGIAPPAADTPLDRLAELFNNMNFKFGIVSITNFDYIYKCIRDLKENLQKYKMVYKLIEDEESTHVFFNLLAFRVSASSDYLKEAYSHTEQYFDENAINFSPDEVFVDCGTCTGDTVLAYISRNPFYKRIYAYEASPENIECCSRNLRPLIDEGNIFLREYAVVEKTCTLHFSKGTSIGTGAACETGELTINGISLDEDILESINFIKMDIEGSEIEAIKGAKRHIAQEAPKLAICVYHKVDDIWRIPELINSINPNYKFMLRHHSPSYYNENVLYAVPSSTKKICTNDSHMNTMKRLKIASEFKNSQYMELLSYTRELYDAKIFFIKQLENYQKDNRELRTWISQLEEGKRWIEKQYFTYKAESDRKDRIVKELQQKLDEMNY